MATFEGAVAQGPNSVSSGDCFSRDLFSLPTLSDTLMIQHIGGKSGPYEDWASMIWDTSSIPLGSTVDSSMLEAYLLSGSVGTPNMFLEPISADQDVLKAGLTQRVGGRVMVRANPLTGAFASLGISSSTTTHAYRSSVGYGQEAIGQVVVMDATGDIAFVYCTLSRGGSGWSTDIVCKVYETVPGDSTFALKGALVATSLGLSPTGLGIDSATSTAFTFPTPLWSVTSGEVYIFEYSVAGLTGDDHLIVYGRQPSTDPGENVVWIGDLHGFSPWVAEWGAEIFDLDYESSLTVPSGSITSGLSSWGNSTYSPDVEVAGLDAVIESMLDDRTDLSDYIGVSMRISTASAYRSWRSSRHASATRASLYGPILTIEYTPPPINRVCSQGLDVSPAVDSWGFDADVAVSSAGITPELAVSGSLEVEEC